MLPKSGEIEVVNLTGMAIQSQSPPLSQYKVRQPLQEFVWAHVS